MTSPRTQRCGARSATSSCPTRRCDVVIDTDTTSAVDAAEQVTSSVRAARRPDASSRSAHGSSVAARACHPAVVQCGHDRVCSRRRSQTSAGGTSSTPSPAHTSCAWRIISSAPRAAKSAAGATVTVGRRQMTAVASGAAVATTADSTRPTVSSASTSSSGFAFAPRSELGPAPVGVAVLLSRREKERDGEHRVDQVVGGLETGPVERARAARPVAIEAGAPRVGDDAS